MAISAESGGEYKITKSRKVILAFSMALCVLTLSGFGYLMLSQPDTIIHTVDIWHKVGMMVMILFMGFVWIGISLAFLIDNDKCENCKISIKHDHVYCRQCDMQKEIELRNTPETLHCIVGGCGEEIESVDAYKDHYLKKHVNETMAEGYSRPSFSKIRITDALRIKKK